MGGVILVPAEQAVEITVDTVTKAAYGEIGLILNYYCDWVWDAANGTAYAVRKLTAA